MNPTIRAYLANIGRRGGRKSRRVLYPQTARAMVRIREARRMYRRFHAECFWSFDPDYRVGPLDIAWVSDQLRGHGGQPINAMLGPSGWGYFIKLEHELTANGRAIGIARYGRSYNGSALYRQQAGVHWILNNPRFFGRIRNDAMGVAFNWVEPNVSNTRDEYNLEVFYRFPVFPLVDATLNYLYFINPALDLGTGRASAFGLRLRTTF